MLTSYVSHYVNQIAIKRLHQWEQSLISKFYKRYKRVQIMKRIQRIRFEVCSWLQTSKIISLSLTSCDSDCERQPPQPGPWSGSHLVVVRVRPDGSVRVAVIRCVRLYLMLRICCYGGYSRRRVYAAGLPPFLAALVHELRWAN